MSRIKSWLKYLYVLWIHGWVLVLAGGIKRTDQVLVLRLDALGDFILWLDSAKEYRKIYPGQKITLLVNAAWLELAKELPYWDRVWGVDVHRFRYQPAYRTALSVRLRRQGFGSVLSPRFSREFLLEDGLVLSSGAQQRTAFQGDLANIKFEEKKWSDKWYTHLVPNPPSSWGSLNVTLNLLGDLV